MPPRLHRDVVPVLFLGIGAATLPVVGLAAGPWVVMVSAAVLATAARGRRAGLLVAIVSLSLQLGVGWLLSRGALPRPASVIADPARFSGWVRTGGFVLLATVLLVTSFASVLERLESAWLAQRAARERERSANEERAHAELEQRRAEALARSAQQLEALGRLAAGVAHDFNNHLLVILSWADVLGDPRGLDEAERREGLDEIRRAATHATQLTRRLLAFAKQESYQPRPTDVDAFVAMLVGTLRRVLPTDVEIVHLRAEAPQALVDEAALGQIVLNLAVNAADAMPDGGKLTLAVSTLSPPELPDAAPDPAESYVALRVTDTGEGMDEATRARLFEPFFTTKAPGKGTGLGLAGVHGLVTQAGGFVIVESARGAGTSFTVAFPALEAGAHPSLELLVSERTRGRRVLLVEDDESARRVMAVSLRAAGYVVVEAGDVTGAIALARRQRGELDLLCADAVMPGEPVDRLVTVFRELFPAAGVLVCAGHGEPAPGGGGSSVIEGATLLVKPFSAEQLLERVGEALGAIHA